MQLSTLNQTFKLNVRWSKEELDSTVEQTLKRINERWPADRTPTKEDWERVDRAEEQIDATRASGQMMSLRTGCLVLEAVISEMVARGVPAGSNAELLF